MHNLIKYSIVMKLRWENLRSVCPLWDERLDGYPGMDHLTTKRGYPAEYRHSPQEWLGAFVTSRGYQGGHVLTQTMRNPPQNLRCPLWNRLSGVTQQQDEHVTESKRAYYGIAFRDDGRLEGIKARFLPARGKPQPVLDSGEPWPSNVHAWAAATPVVWGGRVLSLSDIAPAVSDSPHLFDLRTSEARGKVAADVRRASRLNEVFRAHLHTTEEEAGLAICAEAARPDADFPGGLARSSDYLHHAFGVAPDGVVIVVAHGRLEDIGALAASAGATHAIVTENGGSPQIGLRPVGGQFRPIVESYYFREPSIAMIMYELSPDTVVFDGCAELGSGQAG